MDKLVVIGRNVFPIAIINPYGMNGYEGIMSWSICAYMYVYQKWADYIYICVKISLSLSFSIFRGVIAHISLLSLYFCIVLFLSLSPFLCLSVSLCHISSSLSGAIHSVLSVHTLSRLCVLRPAVRLIPNDVLIHWRGCMCQQCSKFVLLCFYPLADNTLMPFD